MASVTTFAMDEKESIRPDDSASVRAVDDDETSNPPSDRPSFQRDAEPTLPSARSGIRPRTSGLTIAPRRYHTLMLSNPPRFGDLPLSPIVQEGQEQPALLDIHPGQPHTLHDRPAPLRVSPDEKLIEALATPKERLPLLQLEQKLLHFINDGEGNFLDLPPQNSFARLLAHKLADYYTLAHHIHEDGTSIRLFRTPTMTL
jgi:hypothetical protein